MILPETNIKALSEYVAAEKKNDESTGRCQDKRRVHRRLRDQSRTNSLPDWNEDRSMSYGDGADHGWPDT